MYLKLLIQLLFLCGYWGNEIRGEESSQDQTVLLNKLALENGAYFYDTFNEKTLNKWVISEAKKEGVDGEIALYDGDWTIDLPIKLQLKNDYGLVFKQKAKHRAIASLLRKDFIFDEKPFILQYEVLFQDGQECGGGYIKLISGNRNNIDLKKFHDKTPYSIMFGPDKCGTTNKIHFIFRHKNPLNGSYEEKHCIQPTKRFDEIFTDGKPHLFSLILHPDNSFKIFLDHEIINKGSLLTDFKPPVNPPSEIDDPNDVKPENWDERELIPDPDAVKPEDWDESEPHMIPDPTAVKPENWLDNEPPFIRDPSAEKPHDWDNDMDGEWEAPLVPNPACEEAAGCGEWTPPKINNPAYKGKWTPPLIKNPDYKGKWSPRKIPNKDYFVDQFPFKMDPIAAVGFELWSMSANILFDNILITDSEEFANQWAKETFTQKLNKIEESADTLMSKFIAYSNKYPWLWAMYTIVLLVLITLFVHCCFWSNKDDGYEHKKDDEPQPDDAEIPSTDEQNDSSNIETGISSSGDENVDKKESDSKDDENDDNNADDGKTEVLDDTGDISSKKTKTDDENDDIVEGIEG